MQPSSVPVTDAEEGGGAERDARRTQRQGESPESLKLDQKARGMRVPGPSRLLLFLLVRCLLERRTPPAAVVALPSGPAGSGGSEAPWVVAGDHAGTWRMESEKETLTPDEENEVMSAYEKIESNEMTAGDKSENTIKELDLQEKFFKQILNHFDFEMHGSKTYFQRYLITDQYWNETVGPLFFYTGNEGDIWNCAKTSTFIVELALEQKALVVFAEHRYYGKSLPFENRSSERENIGLLSVEQALADYALLIKDIKLQYNINDVPVIVFGGSYGGILSAYMRLKYPDIVNGALASSAPLFSVAGIGDSGMFFAEVTKIFERCSIDCSVAVRKAFKKIRDLYMHQATGQYCMDKYLSSPGARMAAKSGKKEREKTRPGEDKMAAAPRAEAVAATAATAAFTPEMLTELHNVVIQALGPRMELISSQLTKLESLLEDNSTRVTELETRVSAVEDGATAMESTVASLTKQLHSCQDKLEDLENRSRRGNLRFIGLPETISDTALLSVVESWLASELPMPSSLGPARFERVHRVGPKGGSDQRPRVIIGKLHNYRHKVELLRAYRARREPLTYETLPVRIGQDYSAALTDRRKVFHPLCAKLVEQKRRFMFLYPAVLKIHQNGKWHVFDSADLAGEFINQYDTIKKRMHICENIQSIDDLHQVFEFARYAFTMIAVMNYPYPTNFMGYFPANSVQMACSRIIQHSDYISGLRDLVGLLYNTTGKTRCYSIYKQFIKCADPTGCGTGPDSIMWDYQACTELNFLFGSNNITDMFPSLPFTDSVREQYCFSKWHVRPRKDWLKIEFWGSDIKSTSNIIFSNGDLDPWASGGVKSNLTSSLIGIYIKCAGHQLDLRGANEADPECIAAARREEADIIATWVKNAKVETAWETLTGIFTDQSEDTDSTNL
uniref:Dipeptidyl peptidase 2 n=1 Tax=Geotrypetes seraphini TaxID=260995 RepID=A0A6P8SPJ6_GEOSA|nr:dipeptidyl peptidase 2 [Geotrypetes seraphini]